KTAFRNLRANKVYSILTVAGLGVGIAVFLVIFLFIRYQESFDTFHSKKARIYRVLTTAPDADHAQGCVPYPMPSALAHDFPDWKVTGIFQLGNLSVRTLDGAGKTAKVMMEKDGAFCVDGAFFGIFDFPLLTGDVNQMLADKHSVVLSKRTAERY